MKRFSGALHPVVLYDTPPSAESKEIKLAIEHGRPEDIPGLSWNKPNFVATGHKIVCTFSIDRKKRGHQGFVPCAICSEEHPKFLEGAVLWSPDKCLRVIGHICAANREHFGESGYRDLQVRRKQEQRDDAALEWLEANIGAIPAIRCLMEEIVIVAQFIEEQQSILFRNVRPFAELLFNTASKQNGELTVVEEASGAQQLLREATSGMSMSRFTTVHFGIVEGGEFFRRPNKKRSHELQVISDTLGRIPIGSPEDALLSVMDGGEERVTIMAGMALRAVQRGLKLADQCLSARAFINDSNIELLHKWGSDKRAAIAVNVQRTAKSVTFTLAEDRSRAVLKASWPELPNMSDAKRIVDAGILLDGLLPRSL